MEDDDVLQKGIDYSKYMGEWIVICNNKLVAHNKNLTKLEHHVDSCKGTPTLTLIPTEDSWIF